MPQSQGESASRQKVMTCAAALFAEKGFTETTIREIAAAAGIKGGSLYSHFPSKNTILEEILEDYYSFNTNVFDDKDINGILKENPNTEGILKCLQLTFPPGKEEYFKTVLFILLQEQLRNPIVKKYMAEQFILRSEKNFKKIINVLIELGAISQDTDSDYWTRAVSGLFYSFSIRMMLGIGDNAPDFSGKNMAEMLKYTINLMFEKCGK